MYQEHRLSRHSRKVISLVLLTISCVEIVVAWVFGIRIFLIKRYLLMSFVDVEIRIPKGSRRLKNEAVWFTEKPRAVVTKPQPIVLNQLENLFVVTCVYAAK